MRTEIGGEFYLLIPHLFKRQLKQFDGFILQDARYFLTSSGRDSLKLIIRILDLTQHDEVLLPSYLCGDILRPFKEENVGFAFYRVNADLSVSIGDIKKKIKSNTKALLIIHYFGYPQAIKEIQKLTKEHSLYLIEDTAQSFLTKYNGQFLGSAGDLAFTSFRKYLPVLDGSLVLLNREEINNSFKWARPSPTHIFYLCLRYLGMSFKNLYLKAYFVPKPLFLWLFTKADEMLNEYPKPAKISALSESLLHKLDFDSITMKRRGNFQYLLDNWHFDIAQPLFNELPAGVCPLGFPVLAKDRDHVKQELIKRKVYPPIHWNLPLEIDEDEFSVSWEISQTILTIPIDQRYELKDMHYILRQMEEIEGKK